MKQSEIDKIIKQLKKELNVIDVECVYKLSEHMYYFDFYINSPVDTKGCYVISVSLNLEQNIKNKIRYLKLEFVNSYLHKIILK